ncbi:Gfo/Idh/MocA family oxidoreductase [uncultured Litoreibacter sp.]|uniref:Gfo/Idh/MocA family protein n=1 Tax=uncultured Litoreibacter sp. TaxID=1392394 RepID=UPI002636AA92|nr:Gfo/Idh/MocA family oxidoreductase [uncultured Litoreibacter sp.]
MSDPLRIGIVGIDHRHIYGMAAEMVKVGCELVCWWTEGTPATQDGFLKRFPDLPRVGAAAEVIERDDIDLILLSGIPADRADQAIAAMRAGKDVMSDKPGCTTLGQLAAIKACVAETGRIWSIDFSERFEVPAVTRAAELVAEGAIGRVIQTVGIGPHRLNLNTRPDWFYQRDRFGGILTDIASHQIDQFLFFTGSTDADVTLASTGNYGNPDTPELQDFGQIVLHSDRGEGYIRVDWFTPDALPSWGDGRLMLLGTEGTIELRKYVDVGGDQGGDHLFLVNGSRCERIDCKDAGLPYFARLADDIRNRTEAAMPQAHAFKVMELAIKAQEMAEA